MKDSNKTKTTFSLAVSSDYLEPAQTCTRPPVYSSSDTNKKEVKNQPIQLVTTDDNDQDQTQDLEAQVREEILRAPLGTYNNLTTETSLSTNSDTPAIGSTVSINLGDCLACSGCVTSAETVLLTLQTTQHFIDALQRESHEVHVSISPISMASIIVYIKSKVHQDKKDVLTSSHIERWVLRTLKQVFKVKGVYSQALGTRITVHETYLKLMHRLENKRLDRLDDNSRMPVMVSACPGWVLFVEKTQHAVLSGLATTLTPQQITGLLLKTTNGMAIESGPLHNIFHVSVQPCYDKKLESSREDSQGLIDTVLTTQELLTLLEPHLSTIEDEEDIIQYKLYSYNSFLGDGDEVESYITSNNSTRKLNWTSPAGSSAGGFIEYCLENLLMSGWHLTDDRTINKDLHIWTLKRTTVEEIKGEEQTVILARIWGFRNIQNYIRWLTNKRIKDNDGATHQSYTFKVPVHLLTSSLSHWQDFDFVEVMACPGACANGGGQPVFDASSSSSLMNKRESMEQFLALVNTVYKNDIIAKDKEHANQQSDSNQRKDANSQMSLYEESEEYRRILGGPGSILLKAHFKAVKDDIDESGKRKQRFKVQW